MKKYDFEHAVELDGVRYCAKMLKRLEDASGESFHERLHGELQNVSRKKAAKLSSLEFVKEFELQSRKASYFLINSLLVARDGNTIVDFYWGV